MADTINYQFYKPNREDDLDVHDTLANNMEKIDTVIKDNHDAVNAEMADLEKVKIIVDKYSRLATETSDSPRIKRAYDDAKEGDTLLFFLSEYEIGSTLTITKEVGIVGLNPTQTVFKKTANVIVFEIKTNRVKMLDFYIKGGLDQTSPGFTDTTDGIVIGQNDGQNSRGTGHAPAYDTTIERVNVYGCGRDGIGWYEGANPVFNLVKCYKNGRYGLYTDPLSYDAHHGTFIFVSCGQNKADGFYISKSAHIFVNTKAFGNTGTGYVISGNRNFGSIFSELNGLGLEFTAEAYANGFEIQHMNDGYIDNSTSKTNQMYGSTRPDKDALYGYNHLVSNELSISKRMLANGETAFIGEKKTRHSGDRTYEEIVEGTTHDITINYKHAGNALARVNHYFDENNGRHIFQGATFIPKEPETLTTGADLTNYTHFQDILVDGTNGAFTVNLGGNFQKPGRSVFIKKIDGSTNSVTIAGGATGGIEGYTNAVLSGRYASIELLCIASSGSPRWVIKSTTGNVTYS